MGLIVDFKLQWCLLQWTLADKDNISYVLEDPSTIRQCLTKKAVCISWVLPLLGFLFYNSLNYIELMPRIMYSVYEMQLLSYKGSQMVSALVSRLSMLAFGFLYPAYRSYKAVRTKDVKEYVKWMMYWIVFALFCCVETLADIFISWLPFYYELKIVFLFWLLSPYTRGATYIYRKVIHPTLAKHENDIDTHLEAIRKESYRTLMRVGSHGIEYAKEVVATVALRSQTSLANHIRKSQSLNDLSTDPEHERVQMRMVRAAPAIKEELGDEDFVDGGVEGSELFEEGIIGANGAEEVVNREFRFLNEDGRSSEVSQYATLPRGTRISGVTTRRSMRRAQI